MAIDTENLNEELTENVEGSAELDNQYSEKAKNFETVVDYTTKLSNFEGPLDLLLFLVNRAEIEIKRKFRLFGIAARPEVAPYQDWHEICYIEGNRRIES